MPAKKLKENIYNLLENRHPQGWPRAYQSFVVFLVLANVAAIIFGSVDGVLDEYLSLFELLAVFSIVTFSVEYLLRLFSCTVNEKYRQPLWGRVKYALTPMMLVDLIAIAPFYLYFTDLDLRFFWTLRLFRIVTILKLRRYSDAHTTIMRILRSKKELLAMSIFFIFATTLIAGCLVYSLENTAQPKAFKDIPTAIWWAVITMTTVGYGDIYPITPWGKFFGALTAALGMGLFALPAGIVTAGFLDDWRDHCNETDKKH